MNAPNLKVINGGKYYALQKQSPQQEVNVTDSRYIPTDVIVTAQSVADKLPPINYTNDSRIE
ncbi:MAG: hypothetical protein HC836_29125 [Richelia sp. RM2_1_2]|nr:hypothetical protein [Richelia sp. SM2_1_7]NJM18308.1 hypothetical protein [Richelia sp. SM1_7_0]NJN08372.1 hypothetical protein [Richelia sp. RM1_1_1]NJO26915.1 hypothetical protein [Richelia sp. SL_2_1]NJO62148.1 hypothetical protein [Richelia sp. RM2_1_2]